jgi:enoyl-CoA hydratase/carnithine racemase
MTRIEETEFSTIRVDRHDRVLLVTLDRPERLNAYDRQMVHELRTVWSAFRTDPELNVAVITASGTRSFNTGMDVEDTLDAEVASPSLDEAGRVAITPRDLGVTKPVITAVNGYCCAGAWHFVNDADFVLCSDTATFFDTHVDVGLSNPVEAVGLMSRLPRGEVLRMVLSGRAYRLTAQRAYELGLVTEVTSPQDLVPRALEIAALIAAHPVGLLQTSIETMWTTILAERSAAEAYGLAMLARSDASANARSESLVAFRNS